MSSRQENCAYGLLSENRHHKTAVSSSFTIIWFDVSNSWLKQKAMKNWITKIRISDLIFVFWFLNQEKACVFAHLLSYLLTFPILVIKTYLGQVFWVIVCGFRNFCWVWKGLKFGFFLISADSFLQTGFKVYLDYIPTY